MKRKHSSRRTQPARMSGQTAMPESGVMGLLGSLASWYRIQAYITLIWLVLYLAYSAASYVSAYVESLFQIHF